ncbi:MAG: molybdopterin-dependent oxidoreductase [Hymenobacter sp.]|nr:molybdopterin-dependent oxidoreductase [Hymenobacter sp.]
MLDFTWGGRWLLLGWLCLAGNRPAQAQAPAKAGAGIELAGPTAKSRTLTAVELARLPQQELRAKDKDGVEHRYGGVALAEVLALAGIPQGKALHGPALTQLLLVTATDGYQVVFALPELDPSFAAQTVLLADRRDGQPLPPGNGPYQLVVPQEKRPARWVKQVTSLRLVEMKP